MGGIIQKIILILSCDSNQILRIDQSTECWSNNHRFYACVALVVLGYYIPLSAMISPMFQEQDQDDDSDDDLNISFWSFSNAIDYAAPYISFFVVIECFMMICSQFISKGGVVGTIVSQSIAMIVLLTFTIKWSSRDLNKYGLTQNEPIFPFGISVLKNFAFFCGLLGCILHLLRYYKIIDVVLEIFLLFVAMLLFAIVFLISFLQKHSFYNPLDDDLNQHLLIAFDKSNKSIKVNNMTPDNFEIVNDRLLKKMKKKNENDENEEIIIPFIKDKKVENEKEEKIIIPYVE